MRRAVELNVFFIAISSLFHLIITESIENVTKNEEEDSTFKSQIDLHDDYRAGQKLGKFSGPNYSESDTYDNRTISSWFQVNESFSWDNQTWPASYDGETELANYTIYDYSSSNRSEDPKPGTTGRSGREELESNTTEGAQPKFSSTGRNRWAESKFNTSARSWWEEKESSTTEESQSGDRKYGTTGRNRWEEPESATTERGDPKSGTTGRNRWGEPESNTTEGAESKFSATERNRWEESEFNTTARSWWEETESSPTEESQFGVQKSSTTGRNRWEELESATTERSQWGDPKSGTTGRNRWGEPESNTTEGAQSKFSATGRNRWEESEFNTTARSWWEDTESSPTENSQSGDRKSDTTGRNRWGEPESNTTEGAQSKFSATGRNRWKESEFNTTARSWWEETESSPTEESQFGVQKSSTTGRNRWGEPESNTTEGARPKFSASGRIQWGESEFNATARSWWEETESSTTERNRWEEPKSNTTVEAHSKFSTNGTNRWEEQESGTTEGKQWEEPKSNTIGEPEFGNHTEGSKYTESATEQLWAPSTETNNTSYFPVEEEPTTPRPPLLYRNYGYVNDTKDGWLVTLYDESDTPCLKMNLQIVINVYFARNDPGSSLKAASFIQIFPTSADDLTIEGECNNDTSLVLVSWETSNLTWHFDQGENGAWSLREVELSVINPDWFEKYNLCDSPCHPFNLKSGNGSWYDSSTWCRQVNVPLSEEGGTPLKAVVFLMDSFRAEPFARNGTDFETRIC